MGTIIDIISGNRTDLSLHQVALGLGGIVTIGAVATFLRTTMLSIASERIVLRMRRNLFASIIGQEIGFFDKTK
jgi:ABC-type bacteriocin/lantibiotic exporter with double-glycine peptidase domain